MSNASWPQIGMPPAVALTALDRAPVGLCLCDLQGDLKWVNESFARQLGHTAAELTGASLARLVPPELSVRTLAAHAAFLRGDSAVVDGGTTLLHKSGRMLIACVSDSIVEMGGHPHRLMSVADLGRLANDGWEALGLTRPDPFVAMAPEISNDFNNVLSIVLGYAAMLQENTDPERVALAGRGIEKAVGRAATLIKQSLYLSRRTEPALQRGKISRWVEDFVQVLQDTSSGDVLVHSRLEHDLPEVSLDPYQFNHVLATLVQRLQEVVGTGGRIQFINRLVPGSEVQQRFLDAPEPSYALVEVHGLLAERADAGARTRFAAALEKLTERRRDLALLVAHSILANHRGHFDALPVPPNRISFRLYLPTMPVEAPATPAPMETLPSGHCEVLVVDDEESLLTSLSFILERSGCRVIKARDGVEAVAAYREHRATIGLVLCDLGLPNMSGWEAFLKMRELEPRVDAIFMSGHLEETLKAEIVRAGAKGFLQKPFAMREAVSAVKRYFSSRAGERGGEASDGAPAPSNTTAEPDGVGVT